MQQRRTPVLVVRLCPFIGKKVAPYINDIPDYALVQQDLVLDHIYDIRELGRKAGHLIIYVESDTISFELAAQIILGIRAEFDKAIIPFRTMDFVLQLPLPEEEPRPDEEVRVEDFRYEDIHQENLIARIKAAHEELEAYHAEQDAKYKKVKEFLCDCSKSVYSADIFGRYS